MNGGLGGNRHIGTYMFGDARQTFRSQRRHAKSWIRRPGNACSLATGALHSSTGSTIRLNADFFYHQMSSSRNPHHIIR